jgi:hypothetical protein
MKEIKENLLNITKEIQSIRYWQEKMISLNLWLNYKNWIKKIINILINLNLSFNKAVKNQNKLKINRNKKKMNGIKINNN